MIEGLTSRIEGLVSRSVRQLLSRRRKIEKSDRRHVRRGTSGKALYNLETFASVHETTSQVLSHSLFIRQKPGRQILQKSDY